MNKKCKEKAENLIEEVNRGTTTTYVDVEDSARKSKIIVFVFFFFIRLNFCIKGVQGN